MFEFVTVGVHRHVAFGEQADVAGVVAVEGDADHHVHVARAVPDLFEAVPEVIRRVGKSRHDVLDAGRPVVVYAVRVWPDVYCDGPAVGFEDQGECRDAVPLESRVRLAGSRGRTWDR